MQPVDVPEKEPTTQRRGQSAFRSRLVPLPLRARARWPRFSPLSRSKVDDKVDQHVATFRSSLDPLLYDKLQNLFRDLNIKSFLSLRP